MDRKHEIFKVTIVGGVVNVALLAFKFVAGILGGSAAMIADAVHSLSDFVTDIIVLVFASISGKPEDRDHNYGHGKYETLAMTVIGLLLCGVGVGILCNGALKIAAWLRGETLSEPGALAFWAAIVSIVLKEGTFQYTVRRGRKIDSPAVIANAWHHRSDALSSIGTALGIGGAVLLGRRWAVLDPLASLVVSAFIIKMAVSLVRDGVRELMERSLSDEIEAEILSIVARFPDVSDPHHLRTRRLGNHYAIELHIRMDGNLPMCVTHARSSDLERALKDKYGPRTHVAVHVEPLKGPSEQ